YVGRLLERELKDVVGFEGQGGWNGDIKTVRAVLEAGVEHVLGIGKGEGKGERERDVIKGVNEWDRRCNDVYVASINKFGTPGARGVEVKGRMGMTYVQLVDGGIVDYKGFGDDVVEGIMEVVEEIKGILGEGEDEGVSKEEVVGGVYCGMLVFAEHGLVESLGEWGGERLRNFEGEAGELGVSDIVLDGIEGIRTVVKTVDDGVWCPGSTSGVEGLLKGSD
ncbi:hypothetical protein TrRE_jg5568, partial [Triparma retinervis]